jgi:hypothetical protein
MGTFARNRVLNQLAWSPEQEAARCQRREVLCELDGMLAQLEEINLNNADVPTRILVSLRRRGIPIRPQIHPAELIESIFAVQEHFMRQPEGMLPDLSDFRRRMAS